MSETPKNQPSRGRRHSIAVVVGGTSSPRSSADPSAIENSFGRLLSVHDGVDRHDHLQRRGSLAPVVEQQTRNRSASGSGVTMQKPRRRSVVVIAPPSPPATNRSRVGSRRQSVTTAPSGSGNGDVRLAADQLIEAYVNEVDRAALNPGYEELPDSSNEFAAVMREMMNGAGKCKAENEITIAVTPLST